MMQLEEDERKIRVKSVGNVRFIGELYKRQMLHSGIMFSCIDNLLRLNTEESLECLCKLLSTVGSKLEKDNANTREQLSKAQKEHDTEAIKRVCYLLIYFNFVC